MNQYSQSVWPRMTLTVKVMGAYFILQWLVWVFVDAWKVFAADYLLQTSLSLTTPWTVVTHGLIEPNFIGVLFTVVGVWLFGASLEQRWGTAKFLGVQFVAIIASNLVVGLLGHLIVMAPPVGWAPAITVLAVVFCLYHWNSMLSFFGIPMNGKVMLAFFVGLSLIMSILAMNLGGVISELVCLGVGVLFAGDHGPLRDLRTRRRLKQARKKMRIVRDPDQRPDPKKMN